ncbi:hypothetical protein SELMODRAFT_77762 [Selaginella moellendorffii]|uniref:Signal peptidase complex subunit 1 n=1 Tax=Selaginella moellendorffii TaxID=88036 RepID=D8QRB3_SELML|nr:probable signal peptidase complex subunit 1 [Selaginella moellendorffii]EFJ36751.1 hypothetical protein SELMODRAFT_77762 [Selaginella moellendorffii]|eukprot:XP_002961491.1 probable signal peptidase complex subunit 1 [Selaginella moellendorffii]
MDWKGQKLAEELMQYMLVGWAIAAFLAGYFRASFQLMMLLYAGGVILTVLVTVPNWPFFNRHSLKWLDPDVAAASINPVKTKAAASAAAAGKKKGSRPK